jgi:hypothetical protein
MTLAVTDLGESGGYYWLKITTDSTAYAGGEDSGNVDLSAYLSNGQTVGITCVGGGAGGCYVRSGPGGWMAESTSAEITDASSMAVNLGCGGAASSSTSPGSGGSTSIAGVYAYGGYAYGQANALQGGSGGSDYPATAAGASNGADGTPSAQNPYGQANASNIHYDSGKTNTTGLDGVLRCGGGGGINGSNIPYAGGAGGGGDGKSGSAGDPGEDEYGGGGGAIYPDGYSSAQHGGNGVIIIRYTPSAGWSNISKVSGTSESDIAKINGIAKDSIAKINGIAVAVFGWLESLAGAAC